MATWTARVEWAQSYEPNSSNYDEWTDALSGFGGSIGVVHRSSRPGDPTRLAATISLEAGSLRQATKLALGAVEDALGIRSDAVEVLPAREYDRRLAEPLVPQLVGYAEIAQMAGVSRQRARELADLVGFPPVAVETHAGPLRARSQVEGWLSRWERKRGRPRAERAGTAG